MSRLWWYVFIPLLIFHSCLPFFFLFLVALVELELILPFPSFSPPSSLPISFHDATGLGHGANNCPKLEDAQRRKAAEQNRDQGGGF